MRRIVLPLLSCLLLASAAFADNAATPAPATDANTSPPPAADAQPAAPSPEAQKPVGMTYFGKDPGSKVQQLTCQQMGGKPCHFDDCKTAPTNPDGSPCKPGWKGSAQQ